MLHSCQAISIDSVLFTEEWNLHPWECRDISVELQLSLDSFGILHPPIVLANQDRCTYSIIHGYKRLYWAGSKAEVEKVSCIVLPAETDPLTILDILLTDLLAGPAVSFAEKARLLVAASRFIDAETVRIKLLSPLQLKKNAKISDFQKILDQDDLIVQEIHQGRLQEKMVSELLKIQSREERLALVRLFKYLGLGDGKQRRIFSLIRDIAFRQNLSITAFLGRDEIQSIVNHSEMNPPQKAQQLASLLQKQLTPEYNRCLEHFEKQKNDLQLPPHCSIEHAPSFEKDEVTLSITYKSFEECKAHLPNIIKEAKKVS